MFEKLLKGYKGLVKAEPGDWDFSDRRKLVRLKCRYEAKALSHGNLFDVEILDLGVLGLGLRSPRALELGEQLQLSLIHPLEGPSEPVSCEVVWSRPPDSSGVTYAGATYNSEPEEMRRSWVNYVLHELGFTKDSIYSKRRYVRADCVLPGQLFRASHPGTNVNFVNLGVGGTLLEYQGQLPMGEVIKLILGPHKDLPALMSGGKIVRIECEGQLFLHGIDFEELSSPKVKLLGLYLRALLSIEG